MANRRLVLVIGSQCQALRPLSFLPQGCPARLEGLRREQQLVVELRDLLVDGPGRCAPVRVDGESAPGLLINPTKTVADVALTAALDQAHKQESVLVMHFLGHGTGHQGDPAQQPRHLLHVWDTVAHPVDTEPESNGWDPYQLVRRRMVHTASMVGLVFLVDACHASWAKQQVDSWSGVRGELLSAWLGASGDHQAWDGCFTKTLVRMLERGLGATEHHRGVLVPELLTTDLEPVMAVRCPHQAPRLGGFASHNPVLAVARNEQASELGESLGLDATSEALLLRLTSRYVTFAVDTVVKAVHAFRIVAVVGDAGTGKSTLAAALRHPPPRADDVPLALVHAVAFAATDSSVPGLARTLRTQLDRLPAFPDTAARFERANAARWDTLDVWQQQITGPLTLYPDPVRLLVDGLDQLDDRPARLAVRRALDELIAHRDLSHVKLILTSRATPSLDGIDKVIEMPALDDTTAAQYLGRRHLDAGTISRLVEIAAGNWLVLELAADAMASADAPHDNLPALYTDLLARIRRQNGSADAVLAVLAAAGTGPVLPFDLLSAALARLDHPMSRVDIHAVLGDPDLHRVLARTEPGQAGERLGLFHQTLLDHLTTHPSPGTPPAPAVHGAIADAINERAPVGRHTPAGYRTDPLLGYAFDAGPRHRWQAGRPGELVTDLAARPDPVPRVNLTRWETWAGRISGSSGPDRLAALRARAGRARWTGEAGDPTGARDMFAALLPDAELELGPNHPDTLTYRASLARWTGEAGDPAGARDQFAALLPEAKRILGSDQPDCLNDRASLAGWTGEAGDPAGARDLFAALLPEAERILGPDHPETLTYRASVARWTGEAGDSLGARDQFAALRPDAERILGPDHPDFLNDRASLAGWTGEAGDPAGARDQFAALRPEAERILGPDHPVTIRTRASLARWTGHVGDLAGARDRFAAVLPDAVRVFGPEHPDTLRIRASVAGWTGEAGNPAEARDLFAALLSDIQRVFGPDRPEMLTDRASLARWTGEAGDPAGARDQFAALRPTAEQVLGSEHPLTLRIRVNLARWTGEADDRAGARDQFVALLPDAERVFGREHPETLTYRASLARWTGEAGDPAGARDRFATVLPDAVRVFGSEHPDTLRIRASVAGWTGEAGDWAGARDLFVALLPDAERVFGHDHPETLTDRRSLARWTGEAGNPAGARDRFTALLPDAERVLGREHPETLRIRASVAGWTGEAGDRAGARDLFVALLSDAERVLGREHPETLKIRASVAGWTGEAGDRAGARDLFVALLPDAERVLGREHPETLSYRAGLASWTGEAGDPAGARDQFKALLSDAERVLDSEHPLTLGIRARFARWTGETGDRAGARDRFAALLPIMKRVLGPEHRDTRRADLWNRRLTDVN